MADVPAPSDPNPAESGQETLFLDLARETCRDGKISPAELQILRVVAQLLRIPLERANLLANEAIAEYRAGRLASGTPADRIELFRRLLKALEADGAMGASAEDALERLRGHLGIPAELLPADEPPRSATSLPAPSDVPCPPQTDTAASTCTSSAQVIGSKPAASHPSPAALPPTGSASWMEETFVVPANRLKPLLCGNCNGMVPLVKARATKCPYCSHPVDIPDEYQQAMTTRRVLDHRQQRMDELFRQLGRRPGRFQTLLAQASESLVFVLVTALLIATGAARIVHSLLMAPLVRAARSLWRENLLDLLSIEQEMFLQLLPYFMAYMIPLLLLHRLRRRVLTLGQFRFSLKAGSPKIPGGPETCRQCGAPLHVPENAVGVTCPYCSTDNLVGIPADIMAIDRAQTRLVGKDLETALARYEETSHVGRQTAITMVVALFAFTWLGATLKRQLNETPEWPPAYRKAVRTRTSLISQERLEPLLSFDTWHTGIASPGTTLEIYLPAKAGEVLEMNWKRVPGTPWKRFDTLEEDRRASRLQLAWYLLRSFRQRGDPECMGKAQVAEDSPARLAIGLGGWYRIDLELPAAGPVAVRPRLLTEGASP